jgi:DNA polymerase II small subunit
VKYVVIAGDLVDGIGIYPEQLEELTIRDIREQYHVASQLLSRLPEYLEIVVIPGNHDASRKSLPQPPIPRNYAEELYADKRIHLFENPCRLSLHGVEILLDHGTALNDILGSTPGHDFHRPITAMELLLRCRHLAPRYGQNAPIAPERTDRLVIQSVPDIFQAGHIHIHETKKYKGVTLISSGAWQDQTPYQRRMNLTPTTGVATIFDLQTHQAFNLDFNRLT